MAGFDRFDRAEREAGNLVIVFRGSERILLTSFCACPLQFGLLPLLLFLFCARLCFAVGSRGRAEGLTGKGVKSAVNGYVRCFSA